VVVHLGARVPEDGKVARYQRIGRLGGEKGISHPPMIAPAPSVLKLCQEVMD
jgi:hypothetical protein